MTPDVRTVQTVSGRVPAAELGRTLIHEHVLIGFPGWQMDALAPRFDRGEAMARAVDQLQELRDLGVGTFVDPCPMDLGRDVEFLAELSQRSGLRIVCTTGAYFEAEGITHTFRHLPVEDIAAIYIKEITEGVGDTGIRAGAVKIATGAHQVSEYAPPARPACRSSPTPRRRRADTSRSTSWPVKASRPAGCWSGTRTASTTTRITAVSPSAVRSSASTASGSR
jgi:hypothetical protein